MSSFLDFKKKFAVEMNKEIPEAVVDLPSGLGKATIVPMKVKEQKEILKALEKQDEFLINEAFDKLLMRCVVTVNSESVDVDDLCHQDRVYLLMMIRKLISNKAKINHVSSTTEKVYNNVEIDIDKLEISRFQGTPSELFKTIDIVNNIKIKLGPVTRKDDKEVEKWLKSKTKDKNSIVERKYCAYAALIKEIYVQNDETGQMEKQEFTFDNKIEFITEMSTQSILDMFDEYFKTLDFGIKLKFHLKTDEYENENEEAMLLSFFMM